VRKVVAVGVGLTDFGRLEDDDLIDILSSASLKAIDDACIDPKMIDAVYVANMGAGILNHRTAIASALVDNIGLLPAAADTVENGPASGASAVKNGVLAVASGYYNCVLVVGGEKMRNVTGWRATDFVATLTHPYAEYVYGVTLPGMAGMFARLYMKKYGYTEKDLARVAIKNHNNGIKNPYAHVQMQITMEGIIDSPDSVVNNGPVATPLRLYDCCPVTDGAAAVILCSEELAKKLGKPMVVVAGFGQATDTHTLAERDDPTDLKAVRMACQQAYDMAGITAKDVDVAELHDAFTILEIAEAEASGLFEPGEYKKALKNGEVEITGSLPVNPSGGLKACGHPVGGTGVRQAVEIIKQLRGEAGAHQVKEPKIGLTVNFGGFGNNVVALVMRRES